MNNTAIATTDIVPSVTTLACQVISVTPLSTNTFQVEFKSPDNIDIDYKAGHYLQLEIDINNDGKPLSLCYSIANAFDPEHPHRLQLFIQNTSDFTGKVLKYLSDKTANNAHVNVTLPMGQSFLQTDLRLPHILIASGSGIAKIKCLTEAILNQRPNADVSIYWSNRNADDFYLLDKFQDLASRHKNLTFTPILKSAEENWPVRSGYIHQAIKEDLKTLDDTKFYLCGSPKMVYGTIDQLKFNGLKEGNCYSDVFEYAPRQ